MKRNAKNIFTAVSLLLTLTGNNRGQSISQHLSSERAQDDRYIGNLLWSQLFPRLHEAPIHDLHSTAAEETEVMDRIPVKNSPASAKGIVAERPNGGNVGEAFYQPEGSELEAGSYRGQRRMAKRYKLSFYDCIALYCQELNGDDRNNCILNSCNRSRYWPRS